MSQDTFQPVNGSTTPITVGTSSATAACLATSKNICLSNVGTQVVFVRVTLGTDNSAATTADFPVLPNTQKVIRKSNTIDSAGGGYTRVAAIAPATGSTLYITSGDGFLS